METDLLGSEESRNIGSNSTENEVGRAMVQNERESMNTRLAEFKERANSLKSVELTPANRVKQDSLVETNSGTYFLACSHVIVEWQSVSTWSSPPLYPWDELYRTGKTGDEILLPSKKMTIIGVH